MSSSSKRRREEEEQEIADNLLGEELNDLYAANQISAKKANSLLTKSSKAGLNFRHAFKNKVTKKDGVHNAARTLLRWMKKQSAWESFIGVKSLCGIKKESQQAHVASIFVAT